MAAGASDLTRTVPVNGTLHASASGQVYDAVLRVFRGANEILRPGNTPLEYQKQVIELMERELVNLGPFDAKEAKEQGPDKALVKKYFMHGTSHHLGLDVHDVVPPHEPFAEGMVFTIEPGIYIREEGLGVRLGERRADRQGRQSRPDGATFRSRPTRSRTSWPRRLPSGVRGLVVLMSPGGTPAILEAGRMPTLLAAQMTRDQRTFR